MHLKFNFNIAFILWIFPLTVKKPFLDEYKFSWHEVKVFVDV